MDCVDLNQTQNFSSPICSIGSYQYIKKIGSGSTGDVYLAENTLTHDQNAIKAVSTSFLAKAGLSERLTQEIKIQKSLSHPNILQLENVIITNDHIFLILEYCKYSSLYMYITRRGRFKENQAKSIIYGIASGLSYLHSKGISHRDIKLDNILLDENMVPKIADFGLSKYITNQNLLTTPCGSPLYAPPEVIKGYAYDGKSRDIWSLGIVIYAICCGTLPWMASTSTQLLHSILTEEIKIPEYFSAELRMLIMKMLKLDHSERPTIDEVLKDRWFTKLSYEDKSPQIASISSFSRHSMITHPTLKDSAVASMIIRRVRKSPITRSAKLQDRSF